MLTKPTIMKFGGTSVEDSEAFRNVAHIVKAAAPEPIVVVVSAIGGFTDALLSSVEQANDGDAPAATRSLEQDFERHRAIANQLLGGEAQAQFEASVADARGQISELHRIVAAHPSTQAPLRDEIVAFGELLSSQLLGAVLRENGLAARYVDARRLIKTDES
jgi:aspartokinase